jgi:aspartokinase-like uncharacterized kinase
MTLDTVVKVGGGVFAQLEILDAVLAAIAEAGRTRRLLVVPGGGPFADAVRGVDRRVKLPADAAHWMALLAMDQYGHLLASRLTGSVLVTDLDEVETAFADGHVPILLPSTWILDADPLPHTWDVTSDSIAAWIAGVAGASRLVLVKPAGASGADLVDRYFAQAVPPDIAITIVDAADVDALRSAL